MVLKKSLYLTFHWIQDSLLFIFRCKINIMKKNINIFIVLILLFFLPAKIFSEENYYYFRPEINYGSDFMFNPLNLFINGSYDIFRNGSHSKHLINQPYKQGFENVMKNITSPKKKYKSLWYKEFF